MIDREDNITMALDERDDDVHASWSAWPEDGMESELDCFCDHDDVDVLQPIMNIACRQRSSSLKVAGSEITLFARPLGASCKSSISERTCAFSRIVSEVYGPHRILLAALRQFAS